MGKVWGYVRVSTDDQDNSIQNQIERIKEQAAKEGLPLAMIYVDEAVTGKIPLRNRPQGRLLWDAMNPGDVIVFNKVDRVFRSVRDATDTVHTWLDKGISPVILDLGIDLRTPAGRLFFHQLASFAEFEREMIGQRVREVQSYLRKHGLPRGNRPYGWQRDRPGKGAQFVPLESERQLAADRSDARGRDALLPDCLGSDAGAGDEAGEEVDRRREGRLVFDVRDPRAGHCSSAGIPNRPATSRASRRDARLAERMLSENCSLMSTILALSINRASAISRSLLGIPEIASLR